MTLFCIDTSGSLYDFGVEGFRNELEIITNKYGIDTADADVCLFAEKLYSNMSYEDFFDDDMVNYVFRSGGSDFKRMFDALSMERRNSNVDRIFILTDGDVFFVADSIAADPWIEQITTWVIADNGSESESASLFGDVVFFAGNEIIDDDDEEDEGSVVIEDREIIESLVSKYGAKDVLGFVRRIDEGKKEDDPQEKKNPYLATFKKVNHQALVWLSKYVNGEMTAAERKLVKEAINGALLKA